MKKLGRIEQTGYDRSVNMLFGLMPSYVIYDSIPSNYRKAVIHHKNYFICLSLQQTSKIAKSNPFSP